MRQLEDFAKICDLAKKNETLYQETKYCGLLDFLKINIPALLHPNKSKWYPRETEALQFLANFGEVLLELLFKAYGIFF